VLGFYREREGFVLIQICVLPDALEKVEAEMSPESFLNDIAIATSTASRCDPNGTQNLFVERDCRTQLRHSRIIAS
jgi:hypothetical protein